MDRVGGRTVAGGAESSAGTGAPWRTLAERALGLARAFITLDDSPAGPAGPSRPLERAETPAHPHRQPLRPVRRTRRPGAAAPRHHHCLTPVRHDARPRIPGWLLR